MIQKSIILLSFITLFYSCSTKNYIKNPEKIIDFNNAISVPGNLQIADSVDLFVDWSTCVAEAVNKSSFFATLRPNLIGFNPVLWSIKGPDISSVTGNQDSINLILSSIKEINYANLVDAIHRISGGKHQAMLITDGEYWTKPEGERIDLPYMLNDFKLWLTKGFEIFIYVEPYVERYKGKEYNKSRFYFVFTDSEKENNIVSRLDHAIDFASFPAVKKFKLSSTDFGIETRYSGLSQPRVNPVLSLNPVSYKKGYKFEFQEYQIDWSDIVRYIQNASDSTTGKPIPGGDYLFRGIFVNTTGLDYFTIKDIDLRVYNVFDEFRAFEDTLSNKKNPQSKKFNELQEVFILDKELFNKTGEVGVKIHPNFTGTTLNNKGDNPEKENLFKIDIVISKAKDNFKERISDFNCFKWKSMNQPGKENASVYESIKQLIQDPSVNPINVNSGILYTIYIKTPPFNL